MDKMFDFMLAHYNYWIYCVLLMLGFYAMVQKGNLIKKLIGMNIFQTGIILFYISIGAKQGGAIPIAAKNAATHVADMVNPLPHVLMLTAIVVSVSVTGVALSIILKLYKTYGSIDERQIIARLENNES